MAQVITDMNRRVIRTNCTTNPARAIMENTPSSTSLPNCAVDICMSINKSVKITVSLVWYRSVRITNGVTEKDLTPGCPFPTFLYNRDKSRQRFQLMELPSPLILPFQPSFYSILAFFSPENRGKRWNRGGRKKRRATVQ